MIQAFKDYSPEENIQQLRSFSADQTSAVHFSPGFPAIVFNDYSELRGKCKHTVHERDPEAGMGLERLYEQIREVKPDELL
ncbi:hypothetical protein JOB18_047252 [Solea senegalensis]|uniref:Uncharacterized protein n=1 Tax=Solea senegalensis TaxID=28829 RepID=A0AAV6QQ77_SOLSE|nr:hypothetical protein JOB18_047252 [Solea senegalensis]